MLTGSLEKEMQHPTGDTHLGLLQDAWIIMDYEFILDGMLLFSAIKYPANYVRD